MSIRKKGKNWYYEFTIEGKRYNGTCDDCINKAQAIIFEKNIKKRTKEELAQSDIVAYHEKKIVEAKGITTISLYDAYDIALNKPLNHVIKEKTKNQNRQYFLDFATFAKKEYKATTINQIDRHIAEKYINYIRSYGRYSKTIQYTRNDKLINVKNTCTILSHSSINKIHKVCRQVFDLLSDEISGSNPFKTIPLLSVEYENRQIFTPVEIKKILSSNDTFCTPLFQLGLYTGLREGDACCLRWEEVNLEKGYIGLKMRKTKKPVYIPIINRKIFENFKINSQNDEYVLPMHHEMYINNPDGVSYRIKKFLENLGIVTTAKIENRHRRHSTKDFHSCRHTFAMFCSDKGISMDKIQAVLGHTDPKTTQIYTQHDEVRRLQEAFSRISSKLTSEIELKAEALVKCLESFSLLNDLTKRSFAKHLIDSCNPDRLLKLMLLVKIASSTDTYTQDVDDFNNSEKGKNINQLIIDNPELMYEE